MEHYDAVASAEAILRGILSEPPIEQRVEAFAVQHLDGFWEDAQVRGYRLDGRTIYVLAQFCLSCGFSHSAVVEVRVNGEMALVEPCDEA